MTNDTSTEIHRERLLKLADVIEENEDRFYMRSVVGRRKPDKRRRSGYRIDPMYGPFTNECGTTACIAGWAIYLWGADTDADDDWEASAREILGLSDASLFYEVTLDAAGAAARLRDMAVDYGTP